MKQLKHKGFKLLGIRTGKRPVDKEIEEGAIDFLKVLDENTYYPFFSCFSYNENEDSFTYDSEKDIDLYSFELKNTGSNKTLNLNISALVGKNGTGKSSLIDLFYLSIYILATTNNIIKPNFKSLEEVEIKLKKRKNLSSIEKNRLEAIPLQIKTLSDLYKSIECEIYFAIDNKISSFSIKRSEHGLPDILKKEYFWKDELNVLKETEVKVEDTNFLKEFFYSVAVNYSIYGLNSNILGDWISSLFHKNDGYKTPLVINPMRTEGNFDINDENHLVKSRFLSNIIEQYLSEIITNTDKKGIKINDKRFTHLTFQLKQFVPYNKGSIIKDKTKDVEYINEYDESKFKKIEGFKKALLSVYPDLTFDENNIVQCLLIEYLWKKFVKIRKNPDYSHYYRRAIPDSLKLFNSSPSHITTKFNQALNQLKHNKYKDLEEKFNTHLEESIDDIKGKKYINYDNLDTNHFEKVLSEEFLRVATRTMLNKDNDNFSPIEHLFAPIWDFEICFEEDDTHIISSMSSGESQLIHSVQSIIYHLRNISSVKIGLETIKYKSVCIILDEIELYFHPDFQRKFLAILIESIKSADINDIENINILFATHSPFILSDISSDNILFLEKVDKNEKLLSLPKKGKKSLTLGSNIHELLADSFFMENGFMGDWIKKEIKSLIAYLNLADEFSSELNFNKDTSLALIQKIGEPLIRYRLLELHEKKFKVDRDTKIEQLLEKINTLELENKKIKSGK